MRIPASYSSSGKRAVRRLCPLLAAVAVALLGSLPGTGEGALSPRVQQEAPAWSPDGRRIALVLIRDASRPTQIYVANADGRSLRRLTPPACSTAWRPRLHLQRRVRTGLVTRQPENHLHMRFWPLRRERRRNRRPHLDERRVAHGRGTFACMVAGR